MSHAPRPPWLRLPRPAWIALAAVLLIVFSIGVQIGLPIYRQEAAKQFLRKRGISFETAYHGPSWLSPGRLGDWCKPAREWFEDVVTINRLDPWVRGIDIEPHADIADSELALLQSLNALTTLNITGRGITDAGLFHLRLLDRLETLSVTGAAFTDAGLAHLAGLKQLKTLSLDDSNVTASGLAHLSQMNKLEWLDLPSMELTDAGAAHLWQLIAQSNLRRISIPVKSRGSC
ncbi:MAG TPA: hypothetical protein VGM05_17450, partial [Planctomycetaceae bacterium]